VGEDRRYRVGERWCLEWGGLVKPSGKSRGKCARRVEGEGEGDGQRGPIAEKGRWEVCWERVRYTGMI